MDAAAMALDLTMDCPILAVDVIRVVLYMAYQTLDAVAAAITMGQSVAAGVTNSISKISCQTLVVVAIHAVQSLAYRTLVTNF